jgi:glycosyltransferase involved in cell wall biosynthesis
VRILHSAVVTPRLCGLYESCRELCEAEIALGHDARIVDPKTAQPYHVDRGAVIAPSFPEAQVIVNHSGVTAELKATKKPIVHVMHGRPRSSFLLEHKKKTAVLTYILNIAKDPQFKYFVTFWPEHKPYWDRFAAPHDVRVIPPPVDLVRWNPDGPKGYGFHGHKGTVNIVCADAWREDADPFNVLCAAAVYAKDHMGTKVHIYGLDAERDGIGAVTQILKDVGALGEVCGRVQGLENVYRAAMMAICPHDIFTRSVREPMACGCPVVSTRMGDANDIEWFAAQIGAVIALDTNKRDIVRSSAEEQFDPKKSAKALLNVIEEALT